MITADVFSLGRGELKPKLIEFREIGDHRGSLVAVEGNRNIPFDIQRVYYIYGNVADVRRGFHAHKDLRQVAIAVHGSCKILLDNGSEKVTVDLSSPGKGLLIEGLMWREMFDFSADCVLLVFADKIYDEADYIRDYSEFMKLVKRS